MSDQSGFSLPELMLAMAIGGVVLMASVNVLVGATRRNDELQRRTAGLLQSRLAMDHVVRGLRSQVCVTPNANTILPSIAAASATSVTYYGDHSSGGTGLPAKYTLALGSDGTLTETKQAGSGTIDATTYSATPTTRTIGTGLAQTATAPFFQYFAFNTATPPEPSQSLNSLSTPTVAASDVPRISRIVITMQANPEGKDNVELRTTLRDEVFVRLADPDDAAPSPKCV